MKGDFTRDSFDRNRHFSRVLWQQGRVQLDADFNEQTAILLHRQQALAADLIGPHGTPPPPAGEPERAGFHITNVSATDFKIGNGRYYVDGILCENDEKNPTGDFVEVTYRTQADYLEAPALPTTRPYLVYLDVWERHISHLEDPDITEVGLGVHGPDTATRAKVVWQVKAEPGVSACPDEEQWKDLVAGWQAANRGRLKATTVQLKVTELENSCIIPPEARYRGAENQLYRVEIHKSGVAGEATFKWSRDNGSVIFPVTHFAGEKITLGSLGRDDRSSLEPGHWVELVDDDMALVDWRGKEIHPLGKVIEVGHDDGTITVAWPAGATFPEYDENEYGSKHVLLRRWDHRKQSDENSGAARFDESTGTLVVEESTDPGEDKCLVLEEGVQICFTPEGGPHYYRTGDYWLIPARTATRDVEWPGPVDDPEALPPHGVEHHYAPLSLVPVSGDPLDCRHIIAALTPDQRAALNAANNPSQANPFATRNELSGAGGFGKSQMTNVSFNFGDGDGAQRTINVGFRPMLVLVGGSSNVKLSDRYYGGTVSGVADLRGGAIAASCAGIAAVRSPIGEVTLTGMQLEGLCYCDFADMSTSPWKQERVKVTITNLSSTGFTVTLNREVTAGNGQLDEFYINLFLSCWG